MKLPKVGREIMVAKLSTASCSILVACLLIVAGRALACQVPVFRYAFEQWNPDIYQVLIVADKAVDDIEQVIKSLKVSPDAKGTANVEVRVVPPSQNALTSKLWKEHADDGTPLAITLYPQKAQFIGGSVAHVGPASGEFVSSIVDSPARKRIAKLLGEGETAVWVLLECGDSNKDRIARETLESQLAKDAEWLELPTPEEMEIKPEVLEKVKVELRVEFSMISLSRDEPREQFLIEALLNSEEDLKDFDEPIAFPVFGRGIVLYALVGKGISPETVRGASSFICGPCSCQVKEQNPGFDLLISFPWEQAVGETKISQAIPSSSGAPRLLPIPSGRSKKK